MVAPTWITPGCVQFLENRKRFHTAWVKSARFDPLPIPSGLPRLANIRSVRRHVSFVPISEVMCLIQSPLKLEPARIF
jgi:hypothetical protein